MWRYSQLPLQKATVFVNLYNNEWMTNFPEWQGGTWSSGARIWPTQGDDRPKPCVPAWRARLPLLAAAAEGAAGQLPTVQPG